MKYIYLQWFGGVGVGSGVLAHDTIDSEENHYFIIFNKFSYDVFYVQYKYLL